MYLNKDTFFHWVSKNWESTRQKRATCFVTLLQNEVNSDVVRCTIHESKLSCNKSGCRLRKVVEEQSISTFGNKICTFNRLKTNLFCSKTGLNVGGATRNIAKHHSTLLALPLKKCLYSRSSFAEDSNNSLACLRLIFSLMYLPSFWSLPGKYQSWWEVKFAYWAYDKDLPCPCAASSQTFSVNAFRWRSQDDRLARTTWPKMQRPNNEA